MTPWLVSCIFAALGIAAWAWERAARRAAEGREKLASEFARSAHLRAESADARAEDSARRANRLELAGHAVAEACRAELPAIIASIADPVDRARVAGDRLRDVFAEAARATDPDALLPWPGDPDVPPSGGR